MEARELDELNEIREQLQRNGNFQCEGAWMRDLIE